MEIFTTKGMIEESLLEKREKTEEIPCGWSTETAYFLGEELVRQDQHIRMKHGVITGALLGSLSDQQRPVKEFINAEYQAMLQEFTQRIADTIHVQYPELSGLALSFNLPGFKLDIKPTPEPTEQGGK